GGGLVPPGVALGPPPPAGGAGLAPRSAGGAVPPLAVASPGPAYPRGTPRPALPRAGRSPQCGRYCDWSPGRATGEADRRRSGSDWAAGGSPPATPPVPAARASAATS